IGNACFELIERIAQSKGKNICVADLYVNDASIRDAICIPVWKPGHFLLAKPFTVNQSWTVERDDWFGDRGFPRQLYGNDCGIFMLMYALYTILDAPYDFTIIDMPNFDLGSHGKMFAHWTETSKALLRGEGPPVFRVRKRKLDDITEKEEQLQPHPADVSVGKDVEKTMEAPTSKIVQDCKKAAEWVVAHKHLCTRVHLPDAVSMGEAQLREAVKLWEEKPDECDEDEMEASWSHSSLGLNRWKTCGPS
ncbi:Sentrin-specific protease 2, partial [Dissostichus eleginoides]